MQFKQISIGILTLVTVASFRIEVKSAITTKDAGEVISVPHEEQMLQPSDLFNEFPLIKWGMRFEEAKSALERAGLHPVTLGNNKTELAWDGKFNGLNGRGTVLCRESGIYEIAVIAYAMDKQQAVFKSWQKLLTEKHGPARENEDNIATSNIWKFKDGFVIELRFIKDENSPVVDIHWVKE